MPVHTRAGATAGETPGPDQRPDVSCCDGCPGRTVFIEAGNTDGWIATDRTVEITE
jgi:hypothetical protein